MERKTTSLLKYIRPVPAGSVIFEQGQTGEEMYVIQNGRVAISRQVGGRETVMATLEAGEVFGEMAIVNDSPRTATARAVEDCQLLTLSPERFSDMIRKNIEIAVRLIKKLAVRLEAADRQIDLLMHRDPLSRVVHALVQAAALEGAGGEGGTGVTISDRELGERLGLSEKEVAAAIARLEKANLVTRQAEIGFVVGDADRLIEYAAFAGAAGRINI